MPTNITLTVMRHNEGMIEKLKAMLDDLNSGNMFNFICQEIDYETGWSEFMRTAIHGGSLDVSEMGSTWISDFIAMNTLHPFSPADIRELGGEDVFVPALWQVGQGEHGVTWAIPWMTDLSLVYYRRDLLKKAGVDEDGAFSTPEKFEQTISRLAEAGISSPWVVPTRHSYITLHNLSMWLWQRGTDFVDVATKKVLLNEANAQAALRSYFGLYRYLSPEVRWQSERDSDNLFATGGAAVTISGTWLYPYCKASNLDVGMAIPLGTPYVGGSSLVIWNSSRMWGEASKMISLLTSRDVQISLPKAAGLLPARLDVIDQVSFTEKQEFNQLLVNALKNGHTLPKLPLWGMVEDRLARVFENLWTNLLSDPKADLDQILEEKLAPDINRLNIVLSN